jgi:2-iminobutanoate/2-iminopropanoate deaminase
MIRHENPAGVAAPDGQFSQVTIVPQGTSLLFISGQVPRGLDGETVGHGDMTVQAEQVFGNLRAILSHYGSDFSNAVKATIYVTDERAIDELMAVRSRYYGHSAPASTLVVVKALGSPDWLLEVELIAAI